MCLTIDKETTEQFRNKYTKKYPEGHSGRHKIIVWKVVYKHSHKSYKALFRMNLIPKKGIYKSNRTNIEYAQEEHYNGLKYGIHVLLSRKAAREYRDQSMNEHVIKCWASLDDFVAVDHQDEAVFTKITILPQRSRFSA